MFDSVRECMRLRLVYPQVVRNYVSSRKTRKRKSTIYFFKDGSSLEKRKSRFVTWCPDHKPLKCRTMTDKRKVGIYSAIHIKLKFKVNRRTNDIEGEFIPAWAKYDEIDKVKSDIFLPSDGELSRGFTSIIDGTFPEYRRVIPKESFPEAPVPAISHTYYKVITDIAKTALVTKGIDDFKKPDKNRGIKIINGEHHGNDNSPCFVKYSDTMNIFSIVMPLRGEKDMNEIPNFF